MNENAIIQLGIDEDGRLYVEYEDGKVPPKLEFEEETGNIYLLTDD